MSKPKKQRDYNPLPAVSGVMMCQRQHQYTVKDLNPERIVDGCPVCGGYTSIRSGLIPNDGQQR